MSHKLPEHLKQFVVEQHYEEYTPVDQAVWRYVMRQNHNFLGERAHGAYLEGLKATGISIESVPDVKFMDECLSRFGWGAVCVDGFIPPDAFMDFQAHGILAIAADIRTDEHIAYTPAPDIIHESAGHAPIIYNEKYRAFLKEIGQLGAKALSSKEDYELYEAIRRLSILKEDPDADPEEILEAEEDLARKQDAITYASEATLISRLYWWTVEYGLIGDLENPQIYGAGLLSSVGESMSCLKDDVKKIPFSLDCINYSFDITKKQPQLFVCRDFDHLMEVLKEFEKSMACSIGGTESLIKAKQSENTATFVYSSGLQVSGTISELEFDDKGEAIYVRTHGPTALSFDDRQLPGHGKDYHHHGFGSPIGKLANSDIALEEFSDEDLRKVGIEIGKQALLQFESGVKVEGVVQNILRKDGRIVLISFASCTVSRGDKVLFQPEWGTYDMAVGERVISVFAGAADKAAFQAGTSKPSQLKTRKRVYSESEKRRHALYQKVRDLREQNITGTQLEQGLTEVYQQLKEHFTEDWLLRLEILELLKAHGVQRELQEEILKEINAMKERDEDTRFLIENGLKLIA